MVPGTSCASGRGSWLAAVAHRPPAVPAPRKRKPHERVRDLLILVADMDIEKVKRTLDIDMKLKWTDVIGPEWT
eukprot:6484735-Heterocapsa_arctica.AAC.1